MSLRLVETNETLQPSGLVWELEGHPVTRHLTRLALESQRMPAEASAWYSYLQSLYPKAPTEVVLDHHIAQVTRCAIIAKRAA